MTRILALVIAAISVCPRADAQPALAEANLAAGVGQIRDGDYLRAIFSLNDAVSQLAARPESAAMLARVHAYRASAYLELDQPDRAMAAALLALRADPTIVVAPPEFSPAVVKLFADPGGFVAARAAAGVKTETAVKADATAVVKTEAPTAAATATIYVYRIGHYVGSATKAKILCDGYPIGELQNGRYLIVKAAPGAHDMKLGNKQIPLVAEDGRSTYIDVGVAGFGWSAKLVHADEGAGDIREQKMKLNDPGRTFRTECTAGPASPAPKK